jgi:hypothetical protein
MGAARSDVAPMVVHLALMTGERRNEGSKGRLRKSVRDAMATGAKSSWIICGLECE